MKSIRWLESHLDQTILLILVGGLLFRAIVAFYLYPGFDEAYYYLYTLNLDWSYFDHPPLVALATSFGPWITQQVSQFTIRLCPLLLYTGSLIFLYLTSLHLFSKEVAIITLGITSMIPIFQIGFGILTLPDSSLMFFWAVCLYLSSKEFFDQQSHYQPTYKLTIISILVGLSCLGKYHGFILGLGLVGFCLTSHRYRCALFSKWTLLGSVLFVVTLSPVMIWNAQHDWISFTFQLGRAVPHQQYQLTKLIWNWLKSILCLWPGFGMPMWWTVFAAIRNQFISPVEATLTNPLIYKQRFILFVSLPIVLGFTIMGGYREILLTWPMPGFWVMTLLLGYYASQWKKFYPRTVKYWLASSGLSITFICILALAHFHSGFFQKPNTSPWGISIWPLTEDTTTQNFDIQQLRQEFIESPTLMQGLLESDFIFTNQIFMAGQVAMAVTPLSEIPITSFSEDLRGFAFWSESDEWLGKNGLYMTSASFRNLDDNLDTYKAHFQSISKLGEVPLYRGGQVVEIIELFQAKKLLQAYPRPY